ncbi:MAG TPA: VWA domain-containing protein [Chthoniobacterales bacterium]|nr:VWA domain-containing protein [Chthoniobacterales bacterium]
MEEAAMSFGAPEWLWGLLVVPVALLLFLRGESRSAERLREFVAPRLLAQLGATVSSFRRRLRFALLLVALALAFVSLAKPRWGYTYEEVQRKGLDLLVAIDTSRSMLANDVPPNRLQQVKLAVQDLMNELRGDRIGVIAFAGRAFLQAPLTIDYGAAAETLTEIDTSIIPEGGTNISEAINLAVSTFGKSAMGNRALIIFTDGEELAGDATKVAKTAADAGVRIFTVGVGTPEGSLIPLTQAGGGTAFVKDKDGQVVKSKLDESRLREIAEATGGVYLPLKNGPATMQQLYREQLSKMQAGDIAARTSREPIERYQWPLALAIAALAASLLINERKAARRRATVAAVYDRRTTSNHAHNGAQRPPLPTAAMLFLLFGVTSVFAAAPGLEEYRSGRYEEAYRRFQEVLQEHPTTRAADKIQFDAGAAAYKMKDYGKALQSFSQALLSKDAQLQSRSHYNLGNTLYQRGETQKTPDEKLKDWTNALQHYEQTLKLEPQNQQAKDNYEFVKNKIEELKKQQEQQPSPTPTPQQKDEKKKEQQQSQQKQQQKDQQQQQDQQQGGEGDQQKQEPSQDQNEKAGQEQKPGQLPTPSPNESRAGSSPTPSPGQSGSSPSPSPGKSDTRPSPTPGEGQEASPTPSEGDTSEGDAGSSPTPGASPGSTPEKRPTGEVKGASEDQGEQQENASEAAAAEPADPNQMSEQQAENLLRSMRDEERRVQLGERKAARRVYNDW